MTGKKILFGVTLLVAAAASGISRADLRSFTSPGPLSAPHAAFDSLCDKCHVPFKGIPNANCLACHESTAKRIESGKGTHARFGDRKCSSCHGDHKGRKHELSPPVDDKGFDHKVTGFPLEGRHEKARCATCHQGGKWVGMPVTCVGCHADPHHKGALGNSCATCHTPAGWLPTRKSLPDHKLAMTGRHTGLACTSCHRGGTHLTSTKSQCGDCHKQKHGGTKAACDTCHNVGDWKSASFAHDFCTCILPGKHQTASCLGCHPAFVFRPTPFACAACHTKDRRHEDLGACSRCHSALSWKKKVFDHNKMVPRFPIVDQHLNVGCENCHKKAGIFKGAPTACEGCHKTPPGHGDFGACAQCHTAKGFSPSLFSHDTKTRFPLTAPHAGIQCETCHKKFTKGAYSPGADACVLCHGDPHDGQFRPPLKKASLPARSSPSMHLAPDVGPVSGGDGGPRKVWGCRDCHTATGWKPSTISVAEHQGFRFKLDGKHVEVACKRCHEANQFIDTPTACASCHVDAHGGKLGTNCLSCHETTSWHDTSKFDHGKVTGFALVNSHAKVACAACHGRDRSKLANLTGPITCNTCHTPAHGEQFGMSCKDCHKPTRFTDVARFDHRKTMFVLERRHAALSCTACHDGKTGKSRLNPECRSCHEDIHRGQVGQECQDCHRPDRWTLVRFDHDRAEWPLRGKHLMVPCGMCHRNQQFVGLRTECVTCHALDRPLTAHPENFDCTRCHTSFGWKPIVTN